MKHRIAALVSFALPLAALSACSSASHAPRLTSESALSAPGLGKAQSFAVLGGETVTNVGPSTVVGNLGVSPGSAVTGFPPGLQTGGVMHKADAEALQAKNDLTNAYEMLASEPCTRDLSGTDLGGLTLGEGVYCFSSSAQLTGTLVLDAGGRADAVFVFKTVSTLITASNSSVHVINGGGDCGVFWQIGSSATLGTGTTFAGSILALTSISLATGAAISGRALARNGEVTMDDNHIAVSTCAVPGPADAGTVDASPVDSGTDAPVDTAPPCEPDPEGVCI